MPAVDALLQLVRETLVELEAETRPLSVIIKKAARIARLRNDYENLLWLEQELIPLDDREAHAAIKREVAAHFDRDEWVKRGQSLATRWIEERQIKAALDDQGRPQRVDQASRYSVPEIESQIQALSQIVEAFNPPAGLHPLDLYHRVRRRDGVAG